VPLPPLWRGLGQANRWSAKALRPLQNPLLECPEGQISDGQASEGNGEEDGEEVGTALLIQPAPGTENVRFSMQSKDTATKIEEAMEDAEKRRAPVVWLEACAILAREDPAEWAAICLAAGLNYMAGLFQRRVARAVRPPDTRQGLLAFPEYSHVPEVIEVDGALQRLGESTLAEYRASTEALRTRLKSYSYPRVSNARLSREKKELAQRDKLDRQIAPLMGGDIEMKMREGFAAFERLGGSAPAARKQHAIKARKSQLEAKRPPTKNQ
jgi:hypothetical protein